MWRVEVLAMHAVVSWFRSLASRLTRGFVFSALGVWGCSALPAQQTAVPQTSTIAPVERASAQPTLPSARTVGLDAALTKIGVPGLRADVEMLSSDAFLGRAPGTLGEERTLSYLSQAFRVLGLAPAGDAGTYEAKVPLLGAYSRAEGELVVAGKPFSLKAPEDFVAHSRTGLADVTLKQVPIVFVGYGVVAPEFDWDDFKDVDVRGKLVVMLVGDPPVPDARDASKLDDTVFKGRAMTYYGRWTYKYEIASARGAKGVLLVHETAAAGYPYDVVKAGAIKEQLMLVESEAPERVDVEGWITEPVARKLFSASGQDFDALKARAVTREARPVSLDARANLRVRSSLRRFDSHNSIAILPGRDDSAEAREAVVVTAHWDHFGHDEHARGDGTFNGAIDNASGVASMLAIARALVSLPQRPRRSVVFLAPTAEESGLLGAKHYATRPVIPLENTLADVNMDCMNLWGPAHAIVSIGRGTSSLDELLEAEAERVGRVVIDDPEPEKGYFFRSDHLELMRKGVPALHFLHPGAEYVGRTPEESAKLRSDYVTSTYHKVTDEAAGTLRYEGAVEDAQLLTRVILDITESDGRPTWKPGGAFSTNGSDKH